MNGIGNEEPGYNYEDLVDITDKVNKVHVSGKLKKHIFFLLHQPSQRGDRL